MHDYLPANPQPVLNGEPPGLRTHPVAHFIMIQSAALKLQAQERESAEQAEKRLKAALTAKREPNAVSRVVSPIAGETAIVIEESQPSKVITTEDGATKDVAMDVVDATPSSVTPPVVEVRRSGPYPV